MGGMGFRDLRCFNQALLAKQGWRLFGDESSLLHGIFKARYFKHTGFLASLRGFDPSYSWRSIWVAKSLLLEGLKWRVGNGASILVWEDLWLMSEGTHLVPTPLQDSNLELMVSDLLDTTTGCWKVDVVTTTFRDDERQQVLDIPLPSHWCSDSRYWWPTKDGNYTVKSGYWLARTGHLRTWALFHGQGERDVWRTIWAVDGSPKMCHFLWKVCKGSLGVMDILFRRHIRESTACPVCGDNVETIMHSLFYCKFTAEIWSHSEFMGSLMEAPSQSFADRLL